jgi:protein phosphatase
MVRTSNEDSCAANAKNKLFLVADGMGGHAAGEIASRIAASTVEEVVATQGDPTSNFEDVLRLAAQEANGRIYEAQRRTAEYGGMGSTLTVLAFRESSYYIVHVGDSRTYRLRAGVLEQLTRDHSLVWPLFESGALSKKDLSRHPQKNLITRSMGLYPEVEVDFECGEACEGDLFLLCSDGLTDVLSDEDIRDLLLCAGANSQELSDFLVDEANRCGGPDNVTVVVVRLLPGFAPSVQDTVKLRIR